MGSDTRTGSIPVAGICDMTLKTLMIIVFGAFLCQILFYTGRLTVTLIRITDQGDPILDLYAGTNEIGLKRIYEPHPGLFVAESPKVIERALGAGYEPVSFLVSEELIGERETASEREGAGMSDEVTERERAAKILEDHQDTPVFTAPLTVLEKITGYHLTKGMLSVMKRKELPTPEELIKDARRIAVLEDVVNPTNLGAIMRSAAAFGIDAVLLTRGCSDPLYRRAARVSVGTVFQVPWTVTEQKEWSRPRKGLDRLKEYGFLTAAMALGEEAVSIDSPLLHEADKLALILGSEGPGLSEETIQYCDACVKLPMSNGVDSLNVAAAAAVAFWEIRS